MDNLDGGEAMDPSARKLRAQLAAHTLHSRVADPTAHTAPARAAFEARFYEGIDPTLPAKIRERQAGHKRKAYFAALALAGVKARQAKAS